MDSDKQYYQPVRDWLAAHNTTVTIEYEGVQPGTWLAPHDKRKYRRGLFKVTVTRDGQHIAFTFHDSVANTAGNQLPPPGARYQWQIDAAKPTKHTTLTEYDVLSGLQWYDAPSTLQEFMSEFGYENADEALITWHACIKEHADLCKLFTDDERDELAQLAA